MNHLKCTSLKQNEMLKEIQKCNNDNTDDESIDMYYETKIQAAFDQSYTLNYRDYLMRCYVNRAQILKNEYNLEPFMAPMTEISNNEILLYRYELEKKVQKGLRALIEIQFMDSLVILKKEETKEKLSFDDKSLENMRFVMKNLIKFFKLSPPTAAMEIYQKEKIKIANRLNMDISYQSPEIVEITKRNIKMQALSYALGKQHHCRIDRVNNGNLIIYVI